jgi:4-amino-4-deoxy-L-arabinose transferase-like glycosyltransferase
LTWSVVPVVFFSASQSKLPGYILPSVPAAALLVAEYLAELRSEGRKLPLWLAASHGLLCGVLVFAALSAPSFLRDHRLAWTAGTSIMLGIATALGLAISVALLTRNGLRLLRPMTLLAVVVSVAALIRFAAPALDDSQSARSIARSIQAFSHEPVPIALYHVNRTEEYGLEFYLNREAQKYEDGNIPAEAHVLVAAQGTQVQVARLIPGRRVSYLTNMPAHKLDLYWIGK